MQFFHGSEIAFWPNATSHLAGIMMAVSDSKNTEIILESTTNGANGVFYNLCIEAEQSQNSSNNSLNKNFTDSYNTLQKSQFQLIFLPWFWHQDYRTEAENWKPPLAWLEYGKNYSLNKEQLRWAYLKNEILCKSTAEDNNNGPSLRFYQEFSASIHEAFNTLSNNTFIKYEDILPRLRTAGEFRTTSKSKPLYKQLYKQLSKQLTVPTEKKSDAETLPNFTFPKPSNLKHSLSTFLGFYKATKHEQKFSAEKHVLSTANSPKYSQTTRDKTTNQEHSHQADTSLILPNPLYKHLYKQLSLQLPVPTEKKPDTEILPNFTFPKSSNLKHILSPFLGFYKATTHEQKIFTEKHVLSTANSTKYSQNTENKNTKQRHTEAHNTTQNIGYSTTPSTEHTILSNQEHTTSVSPMPKESLQKQFSHQSIEQQTTQIDSTVGYQNTEPQITQSLGKPHACTQQEDIPQVHTNSNLKKDPLILGIDVARGGGDYSWIIDREGDFLGFRVNEKINLSDTMALVGVIVNYIQKLNPHKIFLDMGGNGAAVFDRLKELGYGRILGLIHFASKAYDSRKYLNRRAEIWGGLRDFVNNKQGYIIKDDLLIRQITALHYSFNSKGQLQLEPKINVRKRCGFSPDGADATALTFSELGTTTIKIVPNLYVNNTSTYDPFSWDPNN